jgi:hypothetical protein
MNTTTKNEKNTFFTGRFAGRVIPVLAVLTAALCLVFGSCETEAGEEEAFDGLVLTLAYDGSDGEYFYSLTDGTEITGPAGMASTAWDISVEAHDNSFFILTNSGVTAMWYGTGGQGGVWFTDSKNFNAVTSAGQRVIPGSESEYAPYTEDVTRYAIVMGGTPVKETLNVITYLGYNNDDEEGAGLTSTKPFTPYPMVDRNTYVPYDFTKKQAYSMLGMPPSYTPTNQVYIVKHGDGQGYSKLQLADAYIERNSFVLKINYAVVAGE